ncbi:uncharacterized protein JCM6883_000892 [Sporobolomyces salmoneus]|uniref:uncharacterized protein n=1 Tax=Sporobolomyces salmoneus TaxID=183962 RepID=UPI00317CB472
MPPSRIPSIDLGLPTPSTSAQDDDPDSNGRSTEALLKMIQEDQLRKKKELEKQQKGVLDLAQQASRKYKDAVGKVLKEGEARMGERIKQHQSEENRLKEELVATERQLLQLLQVEYSDTKLASAAVLSAIEENEQARAELIETLERNTNTMQKEGHFALESLWVTDDEFDEEEEERGSVSA